MSGEPKTRHMREVIHGALDRIHKELPPERWKLTVVARYIGADGLDADVVRAAIRGL